MTDPQTFIDRFAVVNEARAWLQTPFHHQASLKGVGADCIGLVKGVAVNLGSVPADFSLPAYSRSPDPAQLMGLADQHMARIAQADMQAGDVIVVAVDKDPQHFGILADYRHGGLSIIHAHSLSGVVIETRLLLARSFRFVAAYALPGVV